jgi:hypothetical protein
LLTDETALFIALERGRRRPRDDLAFVAVDDDRVAGPHRTHEIGHAEHGRQAEGARHDRGVAFRAADDGREAADDGGVHHGRIGGRDLLGDDDGAFRQVLEGAPRRLGKVAHETRAHLAYVLDALGEIGILHRLEGFRDRLGFGAHGGFGRREILHDALLHTAHEARLGQHLHVRVEQVTEFLGRRRRQSGCLLLQL